MRQTNIYLVNGKVSKKVDVPKVFDTPYRPDIIKRAVTATASNKRQPYGPAPDAGIKHSVSTWGKGRGTARVQRIKAGRKATESPNNVSKKGAPASPGKDLGQEGQPQGAHIRETFSSCCNRRRGHCESARTPVRG